MLILLLIIATLFALAVPRSRLAFAFLLLVLLVSIAGNLENPDRINYLANFDGIRSGQQDDSFEPGYQALARLASGFDLAYGVFHFGLTSIALLLIAHTVRSLTARPGLALFAYVCFPFFWDVTQIRNFYAMAIVLYAMKFLLVERRVSVPKYVITILCASLFHITSVFYLLFLLARLRGRLLLWGSLAIGVVGYLSLFSALVASPLLAFIGGKIDVYTTTETSIVTKAALLIFYLTTMALLCWASWRGRAPSNPGSGRSALSSPEMAGEKMLMISPTILLNVNLVAGFAILLALDNLDFIRLFRNIFLINCILVINGIYARKRNRGVCVFIFLLYLLATFTGFVYLTSTSNIIESALRYNVINY